MSQPLVTVITPTYNRADYLPEVIQSVLSQGYERLEYIVLDDGSTDNTVSVVQPFLGAVHFESHANMGEARTVNKAFGLARGDLIFVVNSDDPLLPGAIQAGVDALARDSAAVVAYPDWRYIDAQGRTIGETVVAEYDYDLLLGEHLCLPGPGAVIRRSVIERLGGRDTQFRYVSDYEFWLRAALLGPFRRIPMTLATFRVHQQSLSIAAKGVEMASEDIRMLDKYFALPDLPPAAARLKQRAYSAAHFHAAQVAGRAHSAALAHLWKSVSLAPWHFIARNDLRRWRAVASILARGAFASLRGDDDQPAADSRPGRLG